MSAADDMDLIAAELALGLLDPAERAAAEARLADPAFAARHAIWAARAAAIVAAAPSAAAPPDIWPAIAPVVQDNAASPSMLRWWQSATGLAAAAAIILAVLLARSVSQPPAVVVRPVAVAPRLIAVLTEPKGPASVAVTVDAGGALALAPRRFIAGGRSAELWVIAEGGKPRPLGLMPDRARTRIAAPQPAMTALVPGSTLAVSLEPPGGSPTGSPTGPVVLIGKISAT